MKIPILVAGCVLALAMSVWWVKHSIGSRAAETMSTSGTAEFATTKGAPHDEDSPVRDLAVSLRTPGAGAPAKNIPPLLPRQQTAPQAAQYTLDSPRVLAPQNPVSSHETRQHTSNRSSVEPTPSVARSTLALAAVSSNSNSETLNADPGAIELEPGVPAPAALMPPEKSLPPMVAAAQQQLADSFVQDVNASPNQPGMSDATASDIYDKSLSAANEQYRALFGDAAYNSANIKAGIDAQAGR
jgi:hypothetical protein